MTARIQFISPIVVVLALSLPVNVRGGEEKVSIDKLPKPVVDAVKAKFPEAELVGGSKEDEEGKVLYEVSLKDEGQKVDVELTAEGKIVVIEKTIAEKELPTEVTAGLKAKHPRGKIKKAEQIIKEDKVVAYELVVTAGRRKQRTWEVTFDPSGKFVREEEKKAKEKQEKED